MFVFFNVCVYLKMHLSTCFFMPILLMIADGFTVKGPSGPLVVPLGGSVLLPCSVDSLSSVEDLEVEWKRSDSQTLISLYQDGDIRPEVQHEDYHDRAHFFTDNIKQGNFSLLMKNVRQEDEGQYTCTVNSRQESHETVVEVSLNHFGLSGLHIMVLILCISACGSALLFCSLIYCRSNNTGLHVEGYYWVSLGDSAVLPCFNNKHLPAEVKKVEWGKSGLKSPVCVYEDGAEVQQHEDYHDRAHFFTDDIIRGNFSLLLKNVRKEDEGKYTCTVHSGQRSVLSVIVNLEYGEEDSDLIVDYSCDLVVPLGASVLLPCINDEPLEAEGLTVEWRRSDSDSPVCVYEDGAEVQHEDYHDRACFISDDIKRGNFSLLLKNVTNEDQGEYTCEVYSGHESVLSVTTTLVLRLLDLRLQMFLVFCPNIIMFFAFVFWGVSEGSVIETVSCCSLYILRPLMLLWAAPYVQQFTGNIKTWILNYSYRTEYIVFSTVLYSVLFYSAWGRGLTYAGFEGIMIIVLFGFVLLFCLFYSIFMFARISGKLSQRVINIFSVLARIFADVLPSLQFVLLIYSFGSTRGGLFIVAVLPVILTVTNYDWDGLCGDRMGCSPLVRRSVWSVLMLLVTAVMMFFYIMALENEKDRVGWACKIAFLQVLWTIWNFSGSFTDKDFTRIMPVYVFGSVGVVLISAVALMTELILKIVNGEGLIGDLRIVVFSLETLFIASVLILLVFASWIKPCLQSCQARARCKRTRKPPSTDATVTEMNPLHTPAGESSA